MSPYSGIDFSSLLSLIALAGAYLIWTDFIAPKFGISTWDDYADLDRLRTRAPTLNSRLS